MALLLPYDSAEEPVQIEPDAEGKFVFEDLQHVLGHDYNGRWVRAVITHQYIYASDEENDPESIRDVMVILADDDAGVYNNYINRRATDLFGRTFLGPIILMTAEEWRAVR